MKNYVQAKAQGSSGAARNELSELMVAMTKIAERFEILEKKMDLVISQASSRSFEGREHPQPVVPPVVSPQTFRQPGPPQRPEEAKPAQGQSRGHGHERRTRVLHKAVCADCHKDCEIPFKPTGERPVYCKQCFAKRKTGNSLKAIAEKRLVPELPTEQPEVNPPQRKVIVTKKGVGKVTVSEIVRPPSRDSSQKGKSPKPEKRSKR